MKAENRSTKYFAAAIAVAILATIWATWGARPVGAIPPPEPDLQAFGIVGITFGQTAQLNVSNVHPPPEPDTPPPDPDMPIPVEMMIFDSEGNILALSMARLGAGQSASLSLNRDELQRAGNRVGLRALVKVHPPPDPEQPGRIIQVASTMEVIDNATGKTSFVINSPPEPD